MNWAKVLPEQLKFNEYSGENEWSVDVTPDARGLAVIKANGIGDKMRTPKEKDSRKEDFISFRQREKRKDKDGNMVKNRLISIVDAAGNAWPEKVELGNGTIADVKFNVKDYGAGKKKGAYIDAIRVLKHVPYEKTSGFEPLDEDDEFFAAGEDDFMEGVDTSSAEQTKPNPDDLDDDVPF